MYYAINQQRRSTPLLLVHCQCTGPLEVATIVPAHKDGKHLPTYTFASEFT